MHKENQSMINDTDHLCQKTDSKEVVMLRPHRQHQFHCDEVHRIMDLNTRQNNVSLHVPPFFQDMQKNC
ncbi:hypothetical protein G15_3343 [Enterococcus avium]|uniref:Uncharacterized protein n=1 Tax=Enterococcus malodoratus ATCC 43197 TaxID=1158601 RepID=R2QVF8_9ENTE|nr:hypothetical protein UAI_04031 [Enterococcus malodoratus ATCC 43197]SET79897.1 hypothetical protein SAMN04487821_1233 [Enterococcus malodoratus]BBM19663.1 hypothetical protein G15_3343 [Enterococcus avium]HCM86554.1 hypothetical protein [Enterococcus sp.]EOT70228.1 hypothetical protein I585_01707 [Enterococcus malodoratus ATCC 43197]